MLTLSEMQSENEELARQINEEARTVPSSAYAGKWVALLRGRIVTAEDSAERALTELRKVEPDRRKGVIFEAGRDYSTVDDIWSA